MKIRSLNSVGINRFINFIDSLKTNEPEKYPDDLLISDQYSDVLSETAPEIEMRSFKNRFELAEYLFEKLDNAGYSHAEKDRGLWSWLSLFYFNEICQKDNNNVYKPGALARWVPESKNFQRYYRHLLAGPYRIYKAHSDQPERALALLCGSIQKPGDLVEQLASRMELVTNKALINVSTELYYDDTGKKLKKGAGGKGPGSPRRLADLINQLNLTYDLYAMNSDEIVALLPSEFNKFKASDTKTHSK